MADSAAVLVTSTTTIRSLMSTGNVFCQSSSGSKKFLQRKRKSDYLRRWHGGWSWKVSTKDPKGKPTGNTVKKVEQNMYQTCHNEFFEPRAGDRQFLRVLANSTAVGILGREAAHTGQRITWTISQP